MKTKITPVKITDELKNLGFEAIKVRSIRKSGKIENFSEFIRNLIYEEWKRCKEYVNQK